MAGRKKHAQRSRKTYKLHSQLKYYLRGTNPYKGAKT